MSKAYVCNRCRKVICYSVKQAGTSIPCPFCEAPVNLPADKDFHPDPSCSKKGGRYLCIVLLLALVSVGGYLLFKPGAKVVNPMRAVAALRALIVERTTVAPAPANVRGAHAAIAVKELRYECPDIYHVALKKSMPTEKPVCCVELEITNTGDQQIEYQSWRIYELNADQKRAALTEVNGSSYGLVSFGRDTYPSKFRQRTDIAPGETITDLVFFIGSAKPARDLSLIIPCENLGGKGDLRFTIPVGMIR